MLFWARMSRPSLTQFRLACTIALKMSKAHPKAEIRTERRSLRLWMSIPVRVSGQNADDKNFSEDTETISINAHGGLISLYQPVKVRADLLLTNLATKEEQACRVVTVHETSDRRMHIGIELLSPTRFWGLDFPPDQWTAE